MMILARKSNENVKRKIENVKLGDEVSVVDEGVDSGELKVESGKLGDEGADSGKWKVESGKLGDEGADSGKWKVESGKLGDEGVDNGELKVESGKLDDEENSELRASNPEYETLLSAEREKYLRLAAEYDNFRKRSIKEREAVYGNARADTITRLLPVYDNLERALKMECADEAFYRGVEMTMTQLTEIFENMNVKKIPATGEPFDPNRHDAVMTIEDPDLGEKIVKEECKKGFMLGERIIRHSTVVVAN